MPTSDEIKNAGGNDVGEWGSKQLAGYEEPFMVGGEPVDLDKLPAFGDEPSSMGDLESTGDTGNAGDIFESETKAPLRR